MQRNANLSSLSRVFSKATNGVKMLCAYVHLDGCSHTNSIIYVRMYVCVCAVYAYTCYIITAIHVHIYFFVFISFICVYSTCTDVHHSVLVYVHLKMCWALRCKEINVEVGVVILLKVMGLNKAIRSSKIQ